MMHGLQPGARLGDFQLLARLAVGGMAEVWAALELDPLSAAPLPGRPRVALKILAPGLADEPSFRLMFHDEVEISTQLHHDNVVLVHGVHEHGALLFQSMELVDGLDLRRLLAGSVRAGQRVPVLVALAIARALARALHYAHQRRGVDGRALEIVHRDVSPHNVMVARGGQVKLLDFGIARAAARLAETRTGIVKGKLAYMAPEQALGLPATPQTDIFSAGVVLWEVLASRRLFRAETDPQLLELVLRADVPPIRQLNPEVPAELASLLSAMLEVRPEARPESMREVEAAITRCLARSFPQDGPLEGRVAAWVAPLLEAAGAALPSDPVRRESGSVEGVDSRDVLAAAVDSPASRDTATRTLEPLPLTPSSGAPVAGEVTASGGVPVPHDVTEPTPIEQLESSERTSPTMHLDTGALAAVKQALGPSSAPRRGVTEPAGEDPWSPSSPVEVPSAPTPALGALEAATVATPIGQAQGFAPFGGRAGGAERAESTPAGEDDSGGLQKVRMPRHSEILRAVDAQRTVQLVASEGLARAERSSGPSAPAPPPAAEAPRRSQDDEAVPAKRRTQPSRASLSAVSPSADRVTPHSPTIPMPLEEPAVPRTQRDDDRSVRLLKAAVAVLAGVVVLLAMLLLWTRR